MLVDEGQPPPHPIQPEPGALAPHSPRKCLVLQHTSFFSLKGVMILEPAPKLGKLPGVRAFFSTRPTPIAIGFLVSMDFRLAVSPTKFPAPETAGSHQGPPPLWESSRPSLHRRIQCPRHLRVPRPLLGGGGVMEEVGVFGPTAFLGYLQEMGLPLPQGQPGGSPEGGEAPSRTPRLALHHPGFAEQYPLQGAFNKIFYYLFICGCSGSLLLHTGILELQ